MNKIFTLGQFRNGLVSVDKQIERCGCAFVRIDHYDLPEAGNKLITRFSRSLEGVEYQFFAIVRQSDIDKVKETITNDGGHISEHYLTEKHAACVGVPNAKRFSEKVGIYLSTISSPKLGGNGFFKKRLPSI